MVGLRTVMVQVGVSFSFADVEVYSFAILDLLDSIQLMFILSLYSSFKLCALLPSFLFQNYFRKQLDNSHENWTHAFPMTQELHFQPPPERTLAPRYQNNQRDLVQISLWSHLLLFLDLLTLLQTQRVLQDEEFDWSLSLGSWDRAPESLEFPQW